LNQAPLVIGADGIRSAVRSKIVGDMTPRDNGRTMWRAVIDANLCHHPALRVGTITAAEKGKTMFVINGVGDKLYWAYSLTDEATDGRAKVRSKNLEEAKARLRQEFQGWDVALHILEATDPELILERRVLDLPVLTKWTNGRVAVLGDAAHAVTPALGQGANLAFEDGLELAIQLTSASDLRSALKTYEERRIPRVQIVSARTRATDVAHPQSFYDWLYNEIPSSSRDPVHYEYGT
jgi:salicylate hydroxylase